MTVMHSEHAKHTVSHRLHVVVVVVVLNVPIARLIEFEWCGFDYFERCGIVDKSTYWYRWSLVAEEYDGTSAR